MQKALDDFEACMRRVRALHALYFSIAARLTAAVDLSDILRPEVVLAVSALDYFIHELTRIGMLESWVGTRAQTDALQRYQLPLSIAIGSIERRRGPVERQFPPERPVRLHRIGRRDE